MHCHPPWVFPRFIHTIFVCEHVVLMHKWMHDLIICLVTRNDYKSVWFWSSLTLMESIYNWQWHHLVSFMLFQIVIRAWYVKIKISHRFHWPASVSWFYLPLRSSPVMRIVLFFIIFQILFKWELTKCEIFLKTNGYIE